MPNRDTTSLRRIAPASDTEDRSSGLDVVFVHGLGGDHDLTWRVGKKKVGPCWLDWLQEDIEDITVWALGYPAAATRWAASGGKGMALPQRASGLIDRMLDSGIGSRNVVFVCHSLGGLVVKQVLRHSKEGRKAGWDLIAQATIGVAFLATPHTGAPLANLAKAFRLSRATRTLTDIEAASPYLQELDEWYRHNVVPLNIQTVAYSETFELPLLWGRFRPVKIVPMPYADPGVEGCVCTPLDVDHLTICKPTSREADIYIGIKQFLRRQVLRAAAQMPDELTVESATRYPVTLKQSILEIDAMREDRLLGSWTARLAKMGLVRDHYKGVGQ